jgi:hypothetical protein
MSRKAFVATDAMREMVRKLASRGVPQDDIAKSSIAPQKRCENTFVMSSIAARPRPTPKCAAFCSLPRREVISRR